MTDRFFCRECGEVVIWGERKRRWTHEGSTDDHVVVLAKITAGVPEIVAKEPVFCDRSEMISDPLKGLNRIGTTGSLDGLNDKQFTNPKWIELRVLIDQVWELIGGKHGLAE